MSETKYYEETATASLSAPEIAICLEQIDRMNPKSTYKFRIPALTPDMNNTEKATDKKIVQKNDAIINETNNIEVDNVNISNYLEIALPRELLNYIGQEYTVTGEVEIDGSGSSSFSANESFSGSGSISGDSSLNASGSVSDPGGYVNVSGSGSTNGQVSESGNSSGTITFSGATGSYHIEGRINLVPVDRYIPENSQWIVLFIGGDVNKPRIIAPYNTI